MQMEKTDNLSVRRLKRHEIPAALFLYSRFGRDGAFAAACLDAICKQGEVWGGFTQGLLKVCGAFCPASSDNPQSEALRKVYPDVRWHLMAVASLDSGIVESFLKVLQARCAQVEPDTGAWTAVVPVKTGESLLPGYMAAGFEAHLVRPLYQLRPHYLLRKTAGRPPVCEVREMPARDTYPVSRALEDGFAADRIFWRQDIRWLELYRPRGES
ncbi:hypothetical protein [uncultured Ruthenibacterium sp.]|uniref:hypothetical protein n=1 Tax=uncultured Ruthenibacterium sp. TaxID=1905347 RepID=UPI00349E5BDD